MKVQINSDKQIVVDAKLLNAVEAEINKALERFNPQITRVEVHLSDVNGSKPGLRDKRCQLEVRTVRRKPVSVSFEAQTAEQAVQGAVGKMKRFLETSFGKTSDQVVRHSARPEKGATSPRMTLEKLDRIESILSELVDGSVESGPQIERQARTAVAAIKKLHALVGSRDFKSKAAGVEHPAPAKRKAPLKR